MSPVSDLLSHLRNGGNLDGPQVAEVCRYLFAEDEPVEARAELLEALGAKGETAGEIACFVRTLLGRARRVDPGDTGGRPLIDVCGTGGDKQGLFNISTAVMFVVAACGVAVVKHGNRGITSKSGGADVLEALGVRIELEPAEASRVLAEAGCVFLFAPLYHPDFRAVAPVRKFLAEKGLPSIFNKLGPLLNPAAPTHQLAGVFDPRLMDLYAEVFVELGRKGAWAVHGESPTGGLDEMSTLGLTRGRSVADGAISSFTLDPSDHGIDFPDVAQLLGGDARHNAAMLEGLLRGRAEGPLADIVVWNAAGALTVAGRVGDVGAGLELAREAIRSRAAAARLEALRSASAFS